MTASKNASFPRNELHPAPTWHSRQPRRAPNVRRVWITKTGNVGKTRKTLRGNLLPGEVSGSGSAPKPPPRILVSLPAFAPSHVFVSFRVLVFAPFRASVSFRVFVPLRVFAVRAPLCNDSLRPHCDTPPGKDPAASLAKGDAVHRTRRGLPGLPADCRPQNSICRRIVESRMDPSFASRNALLRMTESMPSPSKGKHTSAGTPAVSPDGARRRAH